MKITVEQALVKTASVEIRTLTIQGKQMTLAVFRQLLEEPVVDYDILRLNGIVWGKVNYHPGCSEGWEHVHLVWQSGTELRRACVGKDNSAASQRINRYTDAVDKASTVLLAALALRATWFKNPISAFNWCFLDEEQHTHTVHLRENDPVYELLELNRAIYNPSSRFVRLSEDAERQMLEKDRAKQAQLIDKVRQSYPVSLEQAREEHRKHLGILEAYKRDWNALYGKLAEVQQLFIAV